MYDGATYFAWFVLALLAFIGVALVIWIGSLPGSIARNRNHPQADAIVALSWLGLLFGGVGWMVAFVWALYRRDASSDPACETESIDELRQQMNSLNERIARLEPLLADPAKGGKNA